MSQSRKKLSLKKANSVVHTVSNQKLELLPDKAIYWSEQNLLLISDVHWGKVDHFRKNGIAIPADAGLNNYDRLSNLIDKIAPNEILFLGDVFHSHNNMDWQVCKTFLSTYKEITLSLVKGNHDILGEAELASVFNHIYEESVTRGGFIFSHEPQTHQLLYNICLLYTSPSPRD